MSWDVWYGLGRWDRLLAGWSGWDGWIAKYIECSPTRWSVIKHTAIRWTLLDLSLVDRVAFRSSISLWLIEWLFAPRSLFGWSSGFSLLDLSLVDRVAFRSSIRSMQASMHGSRPASLSLSHPFVGEPTLIFRWTKEDWPIRERGNRESRGTHNPRTDQIQANSGSDQYLLLDHLVWEKCAASRENTILLSQSSYPEPCRERWVRESVWARPFLVVVGREFRPLLFLDGRHREQARITEISGLLSLDNLLLGDSYM